MEQVFKAWLNVLKGKTTKIHKERAKICNECPSAIYKKYMDFVNDELKEVRGFVCSECGCPLVAKIRSTDDCPLEKWKNE